MRRERRFRLITPTNFGWVSASEREGFQDGLRNRMKPSPKASVWLPKSPIASPSHSNSRSSASAGNKCGLVLSALYNKILEFPRLTRVGLEPRLTISHSPEGSNETEACCRETSSIFFLSTQQGKSDLPNVCCVSMINFDPSNRWNTFDFDGITPTSPLHLRPSLTCFTFLKNQD